MNENPQGMPSRIKRKFATSNGGQRLGMGCGIVALLIVVLTAGGLLLSAALEGGCGAQCVGRGWYGVFAAFVAVPIAVAGVIAYAIGSAVKKD